MANVGTLTASLQLQSAAFIRDLGKAQQAVATNTAQMNKAMRNVESASRNVSKQFGQLRNAAVALGGALAINKLKDVFSGYETSLQRIVGLVGVSQKQVDSFNKSILALGPAVGKGPGELADALFFITSAGLEGETAMNALAVSAKAASAGLGETKQVADAVTSAMNAYASAGLTAGEATDVLVATVREGKLEASQLAGAIGQVLAVAEGAAVKFNEVGATIAALTRIGIGTSEAVTGLRSVLVALQKETTTGAEALKEYGLTFEGLRKSIREKGLLETLKTLKTTVGENETAMVDIFGRIEAVNTVLALTGANAKQVDGIFNRMSDTTGTLNKAFSAVANTAEIEFSQGLSSLEASGIELGSKVIPALAQGVLILADNIKTVSVAVAALVSYKVASYFLATAVAVGRYVIAVRAAAIATGALNAAIKVNPIGLLASAVAIGVASLIEFSDSKDEATEASERHAKALGTETDALSTQTKTLRAGQKAALEQMVALSMERAKAFKEIQELQNSGMLKGGGDITTSAGTVVTDLQLQMIGDLSEAIKEEEASAERARQQLAAMNAEVKKVATVTEKATQLTKDQAKAFESLRDTLIPGVKARREYAEGVELLSAAFDAGQVSLMQYNLMLETLAMTLDEAVKGTTELEKAQKKASDAQTAAVTANDRLREETQAVMDGTKAWEDYKRARDIADEVSTLSKDLQNAGVGADEIKRLGEERKFLLEGQSEAIKQLQAEQALYGELQSIGTRAFDRIGSAVTEMFVQGNAGAFDFKNVMLGVVSEIAQSFIELAAINPLKNALFGTNSATLSGVGGLFGSLFAGFAGGTSISNGSAGGIRAPRFADGGSFMVGPGMPSVNAGRDNRMVSFAARDGERVTVETPGQLRMQSGASTTSSRSGDQYYIDARGADREGLSRLEQMIKSTNASVERRAVRAVADAQRRGNSTMRGAFG